MSSLEPTFLITPRAPLFMGQKRFVRVQKQQARREEIAERAKRPRAPSIREKIEQYNAQVLAAADLSAVRAWSEVDRRDGARAEAIGDGDAPAPGSSRVFFGNLPVAAPPEELAATLRAFVREVSTAAGAHASPETLSKLELAVFGPCRPKTKRDRNRENRGFATCEFPSAADAQAVADAANGKIMVGWGDRTVTAKVDVNNEFDFEFVRGFRGKAPKLPESPKKVSRAKWKMAELEQLPMREQCLSTHTRFSDCDGKMRVRLLEYFSTAVTGMPEIAGAVLAMEKTHPQYLRVKELLESVETFNIIVAHLNSAESFRASKSYDTFFDLACGHGLVGVLLAHAFPKRMVRSFDRARRPALVAFCRAFATTKDWSPDDIDWDTEESFIAENRLDDENLMRDMPTEENVHEQLALANVVFTHGDVEAAKPFLNDQSFVVALHGCNELNKIAIEMARDVQAAWAVMPCCMKTSVYLPDAVVSKLGTDATKYAFMCGAIATINDAQMIRAIDARITNRPIVICGGIQNYKKHCFVMGGSTKIQRERQ